MRRPLCVPQGAIDACKIGVTVAIKYSADRPQARLQGGERMVRFRTTARACWGSGLPSLFPPHPP